MNAELKHQLYGGDISDYMCKQSEQRKFEQPQQTDNNIAEIYDTHIKGKPHIDTTGVVSLNLNSLPVERDPHFKAIDNLLKSTLDNIAKQIGLDADAHSIPPSVSLKQQTSDDMQTANDNVARALKELQDLKAI